MILIKLGGSLINTARTIVKDLIEYTNLTSETIIIVPGGSIFADTVRRVDPGGESAHWMAVLAMEQYGYYLADGTGAQLIESLKIPDKGTYILLPYRILKEKDELPHTWDVTSDTIAAWVAIQLGARFIKVTDVDGIYLNGTLQKELLAGEINGKETCVDAELPIFLMRHKINCEIINGNFPGRLINAIKGNFFGTVIKG
jgi:aspartokinase-like uncharacterized kinase